MKMSEELKPEAKVETPEPEVVETPELSPTEQEALEQGWLPKDKWVEAGNDAEEWRSAREFKERGELFKSIHSTKRDLKQAQAALTALQRHHQMVFDKAHKQAIQDLKKERREALRADEIDRVESVEEEIERLETEHAAAKAAMIDEQKAASSQGELHPVFQSWVARNSWYSTDNELREFADTTGLLYSQKNPGVSPEQVLAHVEKTIRKQFAEKLGTTQRKSAPNPTATPRKSGKAGGGVSDADIEEMGGNIQIMNTLIRSKAVTRESYIEDLKKINKR